VPVHAWLPDAAREGPHAHTPPVLQACCSTWALLALLRFKTDHRRKNSHGLAPGPMMVTMGYTSLPVRGFSCSTGARDIKRLFAYSSIEHRGSSHSRSAWVGRGELRGTAAHDHDSLT